MIAAQILVAGLDVERCHHACHALEQEGYRVQAANAAGMFEALRADAFDVLVFDQVSCGPLIFPLLTSPGAANRPVFTLALVPGDQFDSGVKVLEQGADAFLVEPVGQRELIAHVNALLRRRWTRVADLEVDLDRRRARLKGEPLPLTEREFQLLNVLAGEPGRIFDRETLLQMLWGEQTAVGERTVDALVKRVRQRLASAAAGPYIQTIRGVGYRLAERSRSMRIL